MTIQYMYFNNQIEDPKWCSHLKQENQQISKFLLGFILWLFWKQVMQIMCNFLSFENIF